MYYTQEEGNKIYQKDIKRLASTLGVKPEEVNYEGESYGLPMFQVGKEQEYLVANNEEEIFRACREEIKSFCDDVGIIDGLNWNNMGGIENYLSDENYFEEALRESYEFYVQDIANEEGRLQEEMTEAGVDTPEDYVDYLMDSIDDYVKEYKFQYGNEGLEGAIKGGFVSVDWDKVTQECIDTDGAGHLLSSYDGEELDLGDGYTAYRLN